MALFFLFFFWLCRNITEQCIDFIADNVDGAGADNDLELVVRIEGPLDNIHVLQCPGIDLTVVFQLKT